MKKKGRNAKVRPRCKDVLPEISGETRLYGIVGFPLKHTASPSMHNALFSRFGIRAAYIPLEVREPDLQSLFWLARSLFGGLNVTVPYKAAVIPLIDELDRHAERMQSVNTVCNDHGRLKGYNTDFLGLRNALMREFGITLKNRRVVLLGAGGASSAGLYLSLEDGAKSVTVINRTLHRAESMALHFSVTGIPVAAVQRDAAEARGAVGDADVVINATSLGLNKSDPLPVPGNWLRSGQHVFDMIYNPPLTPFLKAAAKIGCHTANGLEMLVGQGAESFRLWTGRTPDASLMRRAAKRVAGS